MYSSNKKTKIEISEDKTITIKHLDPIQSNKLVIKLLSACLPSVGALCDGVFSDDRSLTLSTAGQLMVNNLTADEIEQTMLTILGGIIDLEGETIGNDAKAINTFFSYNNDVEMLDIFSQVFEESIVTKLVNSSLFKKVMPSINKVKEAFSNDEQQKDV